MLAATDSPPKATAEPTRAAAAPGSGRLPSTTRHSWSEEQGLGLNPITRRLAEARLGQLGLDPGEVDGKFTGQTRRAIEAYQEQRALPVTGYLDQDTVVRLLADGILGLD